MFVGNVVHFQAGIGVIKFPFQRLNGLLLIMLKHKNQNSLSNYEFGVFRENHPLKLVI